MKKIEGKTDSGFSFVLEQDSLNNMELLDALRELSDEEPDPLAVSDCIRLMLGNEQRKRLYDFCRNDNGIVPVDRVMVEFFAIMNACKDSKKS